MYTIQSDVLHIRIMIKHQNIDNYINDMQLIYI